MIQENASVAVFGKALKEFMTISWDKKKKKKKIRTVLYYISYYCLFLYYCDMINNEIR